MAQPDSPQGIKQGPVKPGDSETQKHVAASRTSEGTRPADPPEIQPKGVPLASPTLASLYAEQGHTDIAKAIYSYLARTGPETVAPPTEKRTPQLLDMLLAFREAAQQARRGVPGRERAG